MENSPKFREVTKSYLLMLGKDKSESLATHYLNAADLALKVFPAIKLGRQEFLSICFGTKPDSPFEKTLSFPTRFLRGKKRLIDIDDNFCNCIQETFDIGFVNLFAFTTVKTRNNFEVVDPQKLQDYWIPRSLKAPVMMQELINKVIPDVPVNNLFDHWYEKKVAPNLFLNINIKRMKRLKVRSYFWATFLSGMAFGIHYDNFTSKNFLV